MINQVGFKSKQIKAVNQGQYLKSQKDFIREKTDFFFLSQSMLVIFFCISKIRF